ncbi:S-layer homology domain-containing protein [Cohnella hongkongensis]|uniref:S-layer homology domain-containing protein n=1 Tax=Cohnella hongkongensis TaxID=178337 RepID=A0ABV9FAP0_9BACL
MKKMIICILMLVLVIQPLSLSVEMGKVHAAFGGGDGSPGDPFIILTEHHLSDIRNDSSKHYKLGTDIDLAGYDYDGEGPDTGGWMPITGFSGKLDGNGYVIRNMTINRPSLDAVGLFGAIDNNAQLENIRLLDIDVTGKDNVGGLTGWSYNGSAIRNSYATGSVRGTNGVGGLSGNNSGIIQNSYASVNVSGNSYVGGAAGVNGGTIQNSHATGDINGNERVGGLAGVNMNTSGLIESSYATGSVSGNQYIAGLAGWNYNGSTIRDSYATGSASGNRYVAGLVGWNYANGSAIVNSYATGLVTGVANTGGLVAVNNDSGVSENSYWNTETTGQPTSATGIEKTTAEMKSRAAYAHLDFDNVWGIREGETYPYLLAYKPEISADPLAATMYNLSPGQDALSVTGTVRDNSIGEQITIDFIAKDSLDVTVASATYSVYADGGAQSFARTISLAGWSDGTYTLHITAEDTYNDPVAAPISPLVFMVDSTPPSLADLSLSAGTLSPAFAADWIMYTARVANSVDSITVTPVTGNTSDTVTVSLNGGTPQLVASGTASGQLMLDTGANTITVAVTALNGLQTTYSVTVTRAAPVSDSTDEPGKGPTSNITYEPCKAPKAEIVTDSGGGVKLIIDPTMIEKACSHGTDIEVVNLDDKTLNQALKLLNDAEIPVLTIEVNTARAVQVPLPATWIATVLQSVPNAVIEVRLNGSSFQLVINVLDLEGLASQLGVELKDLKVNVIIETVEGKVREEIDEIAASQGVKVIGSAVDYKVTAAAADGQTAEIRDFGGTYMARAIAVDTEMANKSLTAVRYDPVARTLSFVPSVLATRPDGKREVVMSVPHNSIYAIVETGGKSFTDMDGHWAEADVELLAAKLIVKGVAESRFSPDADITRAEFIALLVRALGLSMNPNAVNTRFTDVAADAWYASAVESAVKAGLVQGMTPQRFAPDDRITREQMAVMIANALSIVNKPSDTSDDESGQLARFTDRAAISSWARDSVARAVAAGIIAGMPAATFAPAENATRAQAAVMLKRFLQHVRFID